MEGQAEKEALSLISSVQPPKWGQRAPLCYGRKEAPRGQSPTQGPMVGAEVRLPPRTFHSESSIFSQHHTEACFHIHTEATHGATVLFNFGSGDKAVLGLK